MKKTLLALCLMMAGAAALPLYAQSPACPGTPGTEKSCKTEKSCCKAKSEKSCPSKGPRMGKKDSCALFAGISLTPEQQAKLNSLNAKNAQERKKTSERIKEAREKSRKQYSKDIEKILTPEQLAQYNANKEKMRTNKGFSRAKGHKAGRHAGQGKNMKCRMSQQGAKIPETPQMP